MKIGDIQSHLRKLQIGMTENGNTSSNHLNSRGLHLNGKSILQFTKNLIRYSEIMICKRATASEKSIIRIMRSHFPNISTQFFTQ